MRVTTLECMGDYQSAGSVGGLAKTSSTIAAAGLAALIGAASFSMAQEPQRIAYRDTNLAQYGVPNFEGMTPFRTDYIDRTDRVPGAETRIDAYRTGSGFVATYTANERLFALGLDVDGKRPLDFSYVDFSGNGEFVSQPVGEQFATPDWVIR